MTRIAFIGGGNMASAIVGGLLRRGTPAADITSFANSFEPSIRAAAADGPYTEIPA